ncbi:hypothetical protein ILUMI_24684 [Ignelater luminosus]|uniref:TIL domain-containing protein n=1 Tax=Ignelater luminosus TaxID=2038154 RepID=A0A8K0CA10_IGNLU|nr:hypothetical protein ILUMI_24684 [Ignelater luminosus]
MILSFTIYYLFTAVVAKMYLWEPRISLPGQCGPREYFIVCGTECTLNCYTAQVRVPCGNHKCAEGCFCKGGYLRSRYNGPCIKENACPKVRGSQSYKNESKKLEDIIADLLKSSDESLV